MNVTPSSLAAATEAAAQPNAPVETEEMSQFLQLLTAQIENQDPLEPLEANQFIEQLATINALEQQIQTNVYLEEAVQLLRDAS